MSDLKSFINDHREDKYWYLPRALYPNRDNMLELREVLLRMDEIRFMRLGDLKAYQPELSPDSFTPNPDMKVLRDWDQELQKILMDEMVEKGIIQPYAQDQSLNDQLANIRNYFNLLKKLGFAYRNKENKLFISEAGKEFLNADEEELFRILERQLVRLQFLNPSLDTAGYEEYKLYPYLFILDLIQYLPEKLLTVEEFYLFIAYAKTEEDIDEIYDLIINYRELDREKQIKLRDFANKSYPDKANAQIHLDLYGTTPTLHHENNQIQISDPARHKYILDQYSSQQYVEYEKFEDWFSYIGSLEDPWDLREIVTYYAEQGQEQKARELTQTVELDIEEEEKSLKELLQSIISERVIEDVLEQRPSLLEEGLSLADNGRQFRTDVGIIDLLCLNSIGQFTVVELKKGRVSDKVIGQALRYMGWVKQYLSPIKMVRGIIVGRDITEKLKFSVEGMQADPPIIKLQQLKLDATGEITGIS